jgi:hypothetical protein
MTVARLADKRACSTRGATTRLRQRAQARLCFIRVLTTAATRFKVIVVKICAEASYCIIQ